MRQVLLFPPFKLGFINNLLLQGLQLVQQISSDSVLKGAEKNSREIEFTPGHIKLGESYKADPGTAGSTTLLLQISFPCLLFSSVPTESPTCLTLGGGTNATQAPQIDYTENIFFPFIQRHFNIQATLEVRKRGYFPRGGGEVLVSVIPLTSSLPAVTLTSRGAVTRIRGKSYTAGTLPPRLAKMMAFEAARILVEAGYDSSLIDIQEVTESPEKVVGSGSGIVLWAETEGGCVIGGSATGAKGTDTRITAKQAAGELLRNLEHGGCVDEYLQVCVSTGASEYALILRQYLQDQIIIFLALTEGDSTIECGPLTLHTKLVFRTLLQNAGLLTVLLWAELPSGLRKRSLGPSSTYPNRKATAKLISSAARV
jgi:RNA 3'-terminal phosphate cyclase (ATP)